MKNLIYLFIIVVCTFSGEAQRRNTFGMTINKESNTVLFSGKIINILNNKPIAGAVIEIDKIGVVAVTQTDGSFKFNAATNTNELKFSKDGNIAMSQVFLSKNDARTNLIIKMIPLNLTEAQSLIVDAKLKIYDNFNHKKKNNKDLNNATTANKTTVSATIRVGMPNGSIVLMQMDQYLRGVVPHEMSPSKHINALKAQAVAARSFASTQTKFASQGFDVDTTTASQVWSPVYYATTDLAVSSTSNVSVKLNGNIIETLFFAHCDGHTSTNEDSFGGAPLSYFRSVVCPCGFNFFYGHGIGMCQEGAYVQANNGMTWENILLHYYTGVTVHKPLTANTPTAIAPAQSATNIALPVVFSFSSPVGATAFRIQVSKTNTGWTATNGFTSAAKPSANVVFNASVTGTTSAWNENSTASFEAPKPSTTYYYTIRSFDTVTGTSSYTAVKSFTTAIGVQLVNPANAATVNSPVNFSWTSTITNSSSRIQISKSNANWTATDGFTAAANANVVVNQGTPNMFNYTWASASAGSIAAPVAGTTYYWTVRIYSPATGQSQYSPIRSFTVGTIAARVNAPQPEANIVLETTNYKAFIYPNPNRGIINLSFESSDTETQISIFNPNGIQVFDKKYATIKGENLISEDVTNLPNGTYLMKIIDGNKSRTERIIINK